MDPQWLSVTALEKIEGLPEYGFRLALNHRFEEPCRPFKIPHLHQIPGFLGFSYRYLCAWLDNYRQKRRMFIDNFDLCPWRPIYGAPVGGIGCGTIGRGYRGEFCRFQMIPGLYSYNTVFANQFIVCIRWNGETVYQKVLSLVKPKGRQLNCWSWDFPGENGTYQALYPRSWTVYNIPECKVRLVCRQVSPIFPHDYKDTSLPCAVFHWTVDNYGSEALDVSLAFTFQNGQGEASDREGGVWSEAFLQPNDIDGTDDVIGVAIHQQFTGMNCTYAVSAKLRPGVDVTCRTHFDPNGDGKDLWEDLISDGRLQFSEAKSQVMNKGEELGVAVCAHTVVQSRGSAQLEFSLAWDMPVIHFGANEHSHLRRYTRFFGSNGLAAPRLVSYALNSYKTWEQKIEDWQNPILRCRNLPAWYKSALFNELYYVSDGGTVWVEVPPKDALNSCQEEDSDKEADLDSLPNALTEYGRFAYLEGHEYRMYNTYDVHHYASFALIMLWPKLQISLQYDIAAAIPRQLARRVQFCMSGEYDVVKASNCVPHDVGDPGDEPWNRLNAYVIHPTHEWKDLNTKFILQVYRDFVKIKDYQYLIDMYPLARTVMEQCLRWDTDGDGIIDNSGFADQTYDAWSVVGASAYCGGMWLAALKVLCNMAEELNQYKDLAKFSEVLERGKKSFEQKLWNGSYYNYDSSNSGHHDSIMSDQLAGHWFLKASGVPDNSVFPKEHVVCALQSIFKHNVLPFAGGTMGAINGMRPNGSKDITSPQSDEFWTGVTYAVAAEMIQEGLIKEAWQTAYGAYHTCYERYGLAFQTPEAYFDDRRYRSLGYMRPLCIWSIQYALEQFQPTLLEFQH